MQDFKTVLITGASEGIGKCFATVFAKHGHNLILVARSADKLEQLADTLRAVHKVEVSTIPMDLIPVDSAEKLFFEVAKRELRVDILLNNAGMMQVEPFCSSDIDKMNNVIQLNIQSLVNMARLFSGPMVSKVKGKIINVGSIASFVPTPNFSVYGATKAFVLSFSEGLSQELKGTGVTVTCVCPGFTETNMLSEADGLEKYIPTFMKADPMELAEQAYQAAAKREVVFLDSIANKAVVQWAKHYPRWIVRGVSGLLSRFG